MLSLLQIKQGIDHLEVCNIIYENYNSFGKRHLLVSLEFFLLTILDGGMFGEQSASYSNASVPLKRQPTNFIYAPKSQSLGTTAATKGLL